MNIVISTSSLDILSSSSTITGINYIMTLVLLIMHQLYHIKSNYFDFYM